MSRKTGLVIILLGVILFMTGCSIDEPIRVDNVGVWDKYFVYPLSWLMTTVAEALGNNYAFAIIIVTILLRLLILPLMIKQTKSTKAMQAIQPEMKKIQEKYSAKDQKTQQKLQEETMKLFQTHGVNPLAGCLPIFVQMPILIAFYHAIIRTPQINPDIDPTYMGDPQTFLWFELGSSDPYFILPLIAGAATYIQQKMMMVQDNPQMKMMLYMMPIMIIAFASFLPSALPVYWIIGNLFMIVQTKFITGPTIGQNKDDAKEKKGNNGAKPNKGGAKKK